MRPRLSSNLERKADLIENGEGYLVEPQDADAPMLRLWDVVEGSWTSPLPKYQADQHLLKLICKCSACNFTDIWNNNVRSHIEKMLGESHEHADAQLEKHDNKYQCSVCRRQFKRVAKGEDHIIDMLETSEKHEGADLIFMHKFTTDPKTPVISREDRIAELERQLEALKNAN